MTTANSTSAKSEAPAVLASSLSRRFGDRTVLDQLGLIPPSGRIDAVATYHAACHLAPAQKVREAPRRARSP